MDTQKINLFIDNNAWDIFFDQKIDLLEELPENEFSLHITPEVEIEIQQMPSEKLEFVNNILKGYKIDTDRYFGVSDLNEPSSSLRTGGFGSLTDPSVGGRFISNPESEFIKNEPPKKSLRPTGLRKDEADTYLAARSLHSVVLTCNIKTSIKRAKENHGGRIIDLKRHKRGTSLALFIKSELQDAYNKNS